MTLALVTLIQSAEREAAADRRRSAPGSDRNPVAVAVGRVPLPGRRL